MFGAVNLNAQKALFTNYTTSNSQLPNDKVSAVAVDANDNIWAATDGGVVKFDGATNWTIYNMSNSGFPNDYIISIAVDKNNNIWAGTDGDGVLFYNQTANTWTTYNASNTSNGLCDNAIYYIAANNDGYIWFGSHGNGASKLKLSDMTWTTYKTELPQNDMSNPASIFHIYVDASNYTWFSTDYGLSYYNNTTFTTIDTTGSIGNSNTTFAIDGNNNRWAGVPVKGVDKLNSSNVFVANYDKDNGLDDAGVTDIKFDSQGNLWIAQFTSYGPSVVVGGITKFDVTDGSGVTYSETQGLNSEFVNRIAIDSDDNIWLATDGGLSKYPNSGDGINENYSNNFLDIYPNPAQDYLNINGNINSGVVEISDIAGRSVLSQSIYSSVKINIANLVDGIYFIKITEDGKTYNGKFIKE